MQLLLSLPDPAEVWRQRVRLDPTSTLDALGPEAECIADVIARYLAPAPRSACLELYPARPGDLTRWRRLLRSAGVEVV